MRGYRRDVGKLGYLLVELCLARPEAKGKGETGAACVQLIHSPYMRTRQMCLM